MKSRNGETLETYVHLAVCDVCSTQGPHYCRQAGDRLAVHQASYKGRPVQILTWPGDEAIPVQGVLMRRDPVACSLTVWS
jgi:hypothetical protein